MPPLISVILPFYNAEKYIFESINSILNQTYKNFELIAIDDGSTDNTLQIVSGFKDNRIKLIQNEKNLGLIATLNIGLNLSQGEFIARMDADDISLPNRFETQIKYLSEHNNVDILGSYYEIFGEENKTVTVPTSFEQIKIELMYHNVVCHPSVMMRTSSLLNNQLEFNSSYLHTEDWFFWLNAISKGLVIENINQVLLKYRYEGQNITSKNKHSIEDRYKNIFQFIEQHFFNETSERLTHMHWNLGRGGIFDTNVKELTDFYNYFENQLIELGNSPHLVKSILKNKKNRPFCKFTDESIIKGLHFMLKNNMYSASNIKYLLIKLKS
jgi:glycosyltransferase involved in cell wall biosynthesis